MTRIPAVKRGSLLLLLLISVVAVFGVLGEDDDDATKMVHPQQVVDWLQKSIDGFFMNEAIGFAENKNNDAAAMPFSLVAKEDIDAGETLLLIPETAMLAAEGGFEERLHACDTAWVLLQELSKSSTKRSRHGPYGDYLFALPHPPPLASSLWSAPATRLVRNITGSELEPVDFGRAEKSWTLPKCMDEVEHGRGVHRPETRRKLQKALSIVQHHNWNKFLVPLYDVVQKTIRAAEANVEHEETFLVEPNNEEAYELSALRDIRKGEHLLLAHQSAAHAFLQHGSVGPYPQTWWIQTLYDNHEDFDAGYAMFLVFHIDKVVMNDDEDNNAAGGYKVKWFDNPSSPPQTGQLRYMVAHLRRLEGMQVQVNQAVQQLTNETERAAILEFYQAWTTALSQAVIWARQDAGENDDGDKKEDDDDDDDDDEEEDAPGQQDTCVVEPGGGDGTCRATTAGASSRYDSLEDKPDPLDGMYNDAFVGIGCTISVQDTDVYETHVSVFQEVEWARVTRTKGTVLPNDNNEKDDDDTDGGGGGDDDNDDNNPVQFQRYNDTCLLLDGMVHSCVSMRPHVHETIVHYPASFLPKGGVKRVLFVGGGDLIILHEIMKYNESLELVIGMELDQHVLRASFRNYAVQPHLDDDRVIWWFGDASKSLALLPEEYMGTFDLVFIDLLSFVFETLKVGDNHERLVDYMMKLLKPEGILIRQEDYQERYVTDFARYTVGLDVAGIPYFCQQSLTMGSNGLDFSKVQRVDHGLTDFVWYDPSMEWHSHTSIWGYFNTNEKPSGSASSRMCGDGDDASEVTSNPPSSDKGVLVIMEAENVSVPLKDSSVVFDNIRKALDTIGFTNVEEGAREKGAVDDDDGDDEPKSLALVFDEGYVVAHTWPELQYCALDLQLWNSMDQRDKALSHLLEAVGGSKGGTSFQITTGGMSGTTGKTVSSQKDSGCEEKTVIEAKPLEQTEFDHVLRQLVGGLIPGVSSPLLLVVCGDASSECQSSLALKDDSGAVFALQSCAGEEVSEMLACENQLQDTVRAAITSNDRKLDGFILDASTPHAMGQVVHKVFNNSLVRDELLGDEFVILAPPPSPQQQNSDGAPTWRTHFLERFRNEMIQVNPVFHADIRFQNSLEMGVLSAGDGEFYGHAFDTLASIEKTTGLKSTIMRSKPGLLAHRPDYKPSKFASWDDYDLEPIRQQRDEQRPLAHQAVFQFQAQPSVVIPMGARVMYNNEDDTRIGHWVAAHIERVHRSQEGYDIKFERGGNRKTFVKPHQLLHVTDYMANETLEFGDHVLINWKGTRSWDLGQVLDVRKDESKEEDGGVLYKVQRHADGKMILTQRNRLTRTRDKPTAPKPLNLTCPEFLDVWKDILSRISPTVSTGNGGAGSVRVATVGSGCVVTGVLAGSTSVVASWDGSAHVDVNLFSIKPVSSTKTVIERYLPKQIPTLVLAQYDNFPRGIGRVATFADDLVNAAWFDSENPKAFRRRKR